MRMSPSVRVSFGLVMFTLSVILIADLIGIVPKKDVMMLDLRKKIGEALAVQLSVAASHSEFEFVKSTLEVFVERNEDVVAASMSKVDGVTIAKFGNFVGYERNDFDEVKSKSTGDIVVVPIFAGAEQWGSVIIEFKSVYDAGLFSFLTDSIMGILLFVAFACFSGFMFILRRTLKMLDPKSVVPERVKKAFNTLSEGVMIIDEKEQIIMANNAFAEKINRNSDDLLGVNASSLKWKYISTIQRDADNLMPWVHAIKEGVNKVGVALKLSTHSTGVRSLSTNCAPINDDKGNTRGALVTFDDVTDVEETNVLLENAVSTLKNNESEIQRKNAELEVLATRDSLTGCYNRRAFFDLFESAYDESERTKNPLTCIMLDIDHFKSINDRFGHTIGDEAIRLIADVLNNYCDHEDAIVGRYGGEEFCVFLPDADINKGTDIAESLRKIIQSSSKGFCAENVTITASFGVSCKPDSVSDCSQILEQADKALYVAKESGRNKVIRWKQGDTAANVNDAVVIDINDKSSKDSHPATDDKGRISLLQSEVEELQSKLHQLEMSDELDKTASIDALTKLPSRLIFMDRVNQAIAYSQRTEKLMAVVTLNVDMFSRINETMGRTIGDEFLRAVGHRLKSILRRSDTVASLLSPGQAGPSFSRLRDDEFALLLTGLDDIESISYIIQRIQNKFAGKLDVLGNEIYVTTTIGLAMCPQDGGDAETLLGNSRRAQKLAKTKTGRNNYQFYSLQDNSKIIDQMQIEVDLHNAVEEQQFVMFYQPKLEMKSGDINSVEALIRWQHPTKGLIIPDAFVPAAEKTGMILDIGKWCLLEACKQAKQWVDMGATNLRMSVNVSAIEFTDADFLDNVLNALKISGLYASNLEIEITESTVMGDQETARDLIEELRFHGITITLDDFGTGYSSLSCFGNLKLDWLKLDRTFLLEAMKHDRSRTIYSSIVKMVHAAGVKVVSEGVETKEEYAYIKGLHVDELQGYLLSKPVDAEAAKVILFPDSEKQMKCSNEV